MATASHTRVLANALARSHTWTANEMLRAFFEVVQQRGLPLDYLISNTEIILEGFRTWILMHHLKTAYLEVYDEAQNRAVERYDLCMDYTTPTHSLQEKFETRLSMLNQSMASRPPLPPTCRYRVVVTLTPGHALVRSWEPTQLRDVSHLQRQDYGRIINSAGSGVDFFMWF